MDAIGGYASISQWVAVGSVELFMWLFCLVCTRILVWKYLVNHIGSKVYVQNYLYVSSSAFNKEMAENMSSRFRIVHFEIQLIYKKSRWMRFLIHTLMTPLSLTAYYPSLVPGCPATCDSPWFLQQCFDGYSSESAQCSSEPLGSGDWILLSSIMSYSRWSFVNWFT